MRISLPLILVLAVGLSLSACSRSLWKEERTTSLKEMPMSTTYSSGINSKEGEAQIEILRRRLESAGREPSEQNVIDAMEALNLGLRRELIMNPSLTKDLRETTVLLLKDPSEEVRFRATELLGKTGTKSEEAALFRASEKDPSPTVREMASEAMELRGIGPEVWDE